VLGLNPGISPYFWEPFSQEGGERIIFFTLGGKVKEGVKVGGNFFRDNLWVVGIWAIGGVIFGGFLLFSPLLFFFSPKRGPPFFGPCFFFFFSPRFGGPPSLGR